MILQGKTRLWKYYTWKDPLKYKFTAFEGSFQVKYAPIKARKTPRGSFPVTSLTVNSVCLVFSFNEIIDLK